MKQTFPIITLHMPWAFWVMMGWKTIETRTHKRFKCLVRKWVGIHASQKWDNFALEAAENYLTDGQLRVTRAVLEDADNFHGQIIGLAYCYDFRLLTGKDSCGALIDCERVKEKPTRWGNFLKSHLEFTPYIKAKGSQGIWYNEFPEGVKTIFAGLSSPKGLKTS